MVERLFSSDAVSSFSTSLGAGVPRPYLVVTRNPFGSLPAKVSPTMASQLPYIGAVSSRSIPASPAAWIVAEHSSRVLAPQIWPMPPPPSVSTLTSPSEPNAFFFISGPVPDGFEIAAAVQELRGALLADVADQALVDAVANQFLQARRERLHEFGREAELLVLLLSDEAGAVVHGNAGAPRIRAVGAAAMPERAVPDEYAALLHLARDRVVLAAIVGIGLLVAARHKARRTVRIGEIGQRPHRIADNGAVRLLQRDHHVVGVDRLRHLTGIDSDGGQRRD